MRRRAFKGKKSGSASAKPFKSDEEFNIQKKENSAQMDLILDKISKHGYDNLSAEEKEFLFRQSKS
jgi:hypothetical protein